MHREALETVEDPEVACTVAHPWVEPMIVEDTLQVLVLEQVLDDAAHVAARPWGQEILRVHHIEVVQGTVSQPSQIQQAHAVAARRALGASPAATAAAVAAQVG